MCKSFRLSCQRLGSSQGLVVLGSFLPIFDSLWLEPPQVRFIQGSFSPDARRALRGTGAEPVGARRSRGHTLGEEAVPARKRPQQQAWDEAGRGGASQEQSDFCPLLCTRVRFSIGCEFRWPSGSAPAAHLTGLGHLTPMSQRKLDVDRLTLSPTA